MEQIALNTVIAVMMAIFPGFLFRKCYYRGEFTKQFYQSNEFDKLLWNVFFSVICIGITFLSVYFFRSVSGLEVLDSLSYDTIEEIAVPISDNQIPKQEIIYKTYKDLIVMVGLIYLFSCFLGLTMHWLVKALRLDVKHPLLRFRNYWYYYIHGGKILYSNPNNKKIAFTVVDVLCEIAGGTRMYKGIISQYTISKDDNNLENLFLTNARSLKQIKDEKGNTVKVESREIPGAAFCIPYKTVANMNLVYVYREPTNLIPHKFLMNVVNIIFFLSLTLVIASLWFDLSSYGILGFWSKLWYTMWSVLGLANFKLFVDKTSTKNEWVSPLLWVLTAVLYILSIMKIISIWIATPMLIISVIVGAMLTTPKTDSDNPNSNIR